MVGNIGEKGFIISLCPNCLGAVGMVLFWII